MMDYLNRKLIRHYILFISITLLLVESNFARTNSHTEFANEINAQVNREGTILVFFVINARARKTEKLYTYTLRAGETSSMARQALTNGIGDFLREGESLSLSSTSIKIGECAVVYSASLFGEYRYGFMKKFSVRKSAEDYIKNKTQNNRDGFKLTQLICNPKREISKSLELNNQEILEIYEFIFGENISKRMGQPNAKDKEIAGQLLDQMLTSSCQMGYAETLFKATANPSATIKDVAKRIGLKYLTSDCSKGIKNGKIYESVRAQLSRSYKSAVETRIQVGEW